MFQTSHRLSSFLPGLLICLTGLAAAPPAELPARARPENLARWSSYFEVKTTKKPGRPGTLCDVVLPPASNPALQRMPQVSSYRALKTYVPDRPGHDRRYAMDAAKIRRELGWAPRVPFDDALRATVGWYLEHRDWCEAVQAGHYDRERLGLG